MDPGPIDGVTGPKTQAALRAFRKDQNPLQTGRMDNQTLAKLDVSHWRHEGRSLASPIPGSSEGRASLLGLRVFPSVAELRTTTCG